MSLSRFRRASARRRLAPAGGWSSSDMADILEITIYSNTGQGLNHKP
jgi:hypothetical protein